MIENLIFISNSLPKSGSSFLFNLQRQLLLKISGRTECDYGVLKKAGIPIQGGYIQTPHLPKAITHLANSDTETGPIVLKAHAPISPAIRELFVQHDNVFMSLIVRDPIDILMSAMENHKRTGEFESFSSVESGCQTIMNHFKSIYESCTELGKEVPIVHYRDLLLDPASTVADSFGTKLNAEIARQYIQKNLDVEFAKKRASHRLQKGSLKRDIEDLPTDQHAVIKQKLGSFREKLGYYE